SVATIQQQHIERIAPRHLDPCGILQIGSLSLLQAELQLANESWDTGTSAQYQTRLARIDHRAQIQFAIDSLGLAILGARLAQMTGIRLHPPAHDLVAQLELLRLAGFLASTEQQTPALSTQVRLVIKQQLAVPALCFRIGEID